MAKTNIGNDSLLKRTENKEKTFQLSGQIYSVTSAVTFEKKKDNNFLVIHYLTKA